MSKRRTKEEIIAQILESARVEVSKSRIMYESFLNYSQLEKYLGYTLDLGLIKHDNDRYAITSKGIEYLELFNELRQAENAASTKYAILTKFLRWEYAKRRTKEY